MSEGTKKNKDGIEENYLFAWRGQTTRESEIASVLGWAAARKIPFTEALSTLVPNKPAFESQRLPKFLSKLISSKKFYRKISFAIEDLNKGMSLASSLRRNLSKYLSSTYLKAVEKAENEDLLDVILPRLAESSRISSGLRAGYKSSTFYPMIQFSVIAVFICLIYVFIIPNFREIVNCELLNELDFPLLYNFLVNKTEFLSKSIINLLMTALIVVVFFPLRLMFQNSDFLIFLGIVLQLLFLFTIPPLLLMMILKLIKFLVSPITEFLEKILFFIPLLGNQIREQVLLELSSYMSAVLNAGFDISSAARWNSDVMKRKWIARRVSDFADEVERGVYWPDAWEKMGLCTAYENWLIRNSASLENPADGFEKLSQTLSLSIQRRARIIFVLIENIVILFNASFIGIFAFSLMEVLWKIIFVMSA